MTTEDNWEQVSATMIDKTIDNKYTILQEIGRGAFGIVFLGQNLQTKEYVAVKVLCKKDLDESKLKLQQLEIDIQQSLEHPHLLGLHQVIQEPDFVFMIMDLCEYDLFDYALCNHNREDCHVIFLQILEAIEHMHENNIYHRDIKLENILIETEFSIKVADFGLATRDRYTTDFECGSPFYLGPEHFDITNDTCDAAASDIWSLGILLLALLFGRNPWQKANEMDEAFANFKQNPKSLMTLYPGLDLDYFQFLQKILAIDPAERVSISEMITLFSDLTIDKQHKPNRASYDSAVFSQVEDDSSWSDMVEKDIFDAIKDDFEFIALDSTEEDQEQFIHDKEKKSWWL